MTERHVVIIGAGIGGLSAAIDLASSGYRVTLVERLPVPGGKMREVRVGGTAVDSGPTVFTMRRVFDALFDDAGLNFDDFVSLTPAATLARHSWTDGSRLDLFADVDASADAIGTFAGAGEARAYRRFAAKSQQVFETLDETFMRAEKPGPVSLSLSLGFSRLPRLYATHPFRDLWSELGRIFRDPRLRQLFARYATYCGSSPFAAPATLMLIAHAERAGVWLVRGGMQRLAEALAAAARAAGAELRFGASAVRLDVHAGRAAGVELDDGMLVAADAIIFNGDANALQEGLLGTPARGAVARRSGEPRSLSALTWSLLARPRGFPLAHHSVFFGSDYSAEFDALFNRGDICEEPTVYVCAQDRGEGRKHETDAAERLFLLINAPPRQFVSAEVARHEKRVFDVLRRHGMEIGQIADGPTVTTPNDFAERFPGSHGAIYGWPTHGWSGSFRRPGSRSRLPGLYLVGGTVHPGPGVPMVALSGRIAAESVRQDLS